MPPPLNHSPLALFAQRTRIPTSARSIGFCVIWVCISSSSHPYLLCLGSKFSVVVADVTTIRAIPAFEGLNNGVTAHEVLLELELIQTQMTQEPVLRAEVGMRVRCFTAIANISNSCNLDPSISR